MTLRTKTFLIIAAIIAVVVVATTGTSVYFTRRGLEQTVISDISMIRDIANELVSSEINLIKSQAMGAANRLKNTPMDRWGAVLKEEVEASGIFKSMTILERDGLVVASHGQPQATQDLLFSDFSRRVFNGVTIITTTYRAPNGELVFYVCVPLAQMILSASISGMYFTEMLEKFRVWGSGSLYILDNEGTVIANQRHHFVLNRYNCLRDPHQDRDTLTSQTFTRRMLRNHDGSGSYYLEGIERVAVFAHITSSNSGWVLGVSAPLQESPAAFVGRVLTVMTFALLALGLLMAYFASAFVNKQFRIINDQYAHLTELSVLAQSASEAKTLFLANMSHEMRTPLNAIIGFSELIIHGHSEPAEREGDLRKIHHAGVTLLGLVNDILDISKIESGRFDLADHEYDLASVINDSVSQNLHRIGDKPVKFRLSVDPALPSRLLGDDLRLKQIMSNLLSNAFKYTISGEVELSISGREEAGGLRLVIRVEDTGVGIRPEDLDKLFGDYSRLDTRLHRSVEGTGLGLSITKRLVELMDGTIEVDSVHGRGSTFTASVLQGRVEAPPIGEMAARALEAHRPRASERRGRAEPPVARPIPYGRVLVVDDVAANLDVARRAMRPYGLTVDLASSGRESVDLVRSAKARYDAIFMDHMMPGMDGVEAVKAIRALDSEYARTVPVIALTANAIVGNEQMFLANGFQAYMSKPIDLGRLDEILDAWVRDPARELAESQIRGRGPAASPPAPQGPSPEGPAPQGPAPQGPASDGPAPEGAGPERAGAAFDPSAAAAPADSERGIEPYQPRPGKPPQPPVSEAVIQAAKELDSVDLAEGLKRFSGDRFAYFEVLRSYRDSAAELLARLRNPDSENLKDYTIAIHGLKSSSYGVCAKTIGRLAERLESKASEGDLEYVQANNPSFVAAVERVMESLGKFVDVVDQRRTLKPERQTPPPEPLERLRAACRAYDMDGVDAAIVEIDAYWYPSDPKLADWLKDRAEVMDFQGILDRFPGR